VTATAYFGDLLAWQGWCLERDVHPLAARRHHVDTWVKHLAEQPQPRTGRPAAPASIARRLYCLSRFYDYGMREVELLESSPVANVRRPKVSEDSPTIGLDAAELDRLLTAAEADGPSAAALVSLLIYNGLRIAEALRCDVEDVTYQRGHRVLRIVRKGGAGATEPLAPIVVRVLGTSRRRCLRRRRPVPAQRPAYRGAAIAEDRPISSTVSSRSSCTRRAVRTWSGFSFAGRPSLRPRGRATARPAPVRSRMISRSHWVSAPNRGTTLRPPAVDLRAPAYQNGQQESSGRASRAARLASRRCPVDSLRVIAQICRCSLRGEMPSSRLMSEPERHVFW